MAFELSLIVGGTTYSLSDGNPYSVQDAVGLGLPPVQRFSGRYPRQDGYDDSGYVLEPRVVTLALSFVATTASALDGYRDDLLSMFSPGVTATLQVERDDGETRRVDVVTTSAPQITLDPAHRPGNLHRAVVQLRAADPIWYAPSPGTVTFGTTDTSIWYLASSTIDEASVLEATTNIVGSAAFNWGTAVQRTNNGGYEFTIGVRVAMDQIPGTSTIYNVAGPEATLNITDWPSPSDNVARARVVTPGGGVLYGYYGPPADNGTASYVLTMKNGQLKGYYNTTKSFDLPFTPADSIEVTLSGLQTQWFFSGGTVGTILYAATYDRFLSDAQASALGNAMGGTLESYALGATVPYTGSYDDLPVITLTGPLGDPVVTNVTTNRKLDFTGSTISAGIVYTIDLSRDTLSVVDQGGTIHTDELTDDSDLGGWALVAGQSNYVQVTAATSGTASAAQIVYRNRYVSY